MSAFRHKSRRLLFDAGDFAAFAPSASMSFTRSALLVMMVTSCPAAVNIFANGLLIFPNDPVNVNLIMLFLIVENKGIFVLTFIQVLTPKYVL